MIVFFYVFRTMRVSSGSLFHYSPDSRLISITFIFDCIIFFSDSYLSSRHYRAMSSLRDNDFLPCSQVLLFSTLIQSYYSVWFSYIYYDFTLLLSVLVWLSGSFLSFAVSLLCFLPCLLALFSSRCISSLSYSSCWQHSYYSFRSWRYF